MSVGTLSELRELQRNVRRLQAQVEELRRSLAGQVTGGNAINISQPVKQGGLVGSLGDIAICDSAAGYANTLGLRGDAVVHSYTNGWSQTLESLGACVYTVTVRSGSSPNYVYTLVQTGGTASITINEANIIGGNYFEQGPFGFSDSYQAQQ